MRNRRLGVSRGRGKGSLNEGQGVCGTMHSGLDWQILCTQNAGKVHAPTSPHVGKTRFERILVPKEQALETPPDIVWHLTNCIL